MKRLVVLISGNGSNLQAILNACQSGQLAAQVVAVIANVPDAYGLQRAQQADVPAFALPKLKTETRVQYDARLADFVKAWQPDWVVLAGWMRLLSITFLARFPMQVINPHPALPGTFPGTHAIERAFAAYQAGQIRETGIMVHFVPDEQVDAGPVIAQRVVPIEPTDTLDTFAERVHQTEWQLLVAVLQSLVQPD